jgi:hypothetical protein
MKRSLNAREKRLLIICVLTLVVVGNALVIRDFVGRRKAAMTTLSSLKEQESSNLIWMNERAVYEKRLVWLEQNMP